MYTRDMATSLKKQPKPKKKLTKRQQEAREINDANYKRGYDDGFSHIDKWGIPGKWGVPTLYEGTRLDIHALYGHYRRGFVDGYNDNLEVMRLS